MMNALELSLNWLIIDLKNERLDLLEELTHDISENRTARIRGQILMIDMILNKILAT